MTTRRITYGLIVAALGVGALCAFTPPTEKNDAPGTPTQGGGTDGVGVVAYDPPGAADSFVGSYGTFVGNRFDTRVGNPLEAGNITQVAFVCGDASCTFPGFGVFPDNGVGTLYFQFTTGIVPFTYNTVGVATPPNLVPPVLAGVFVSSAFGSSADSVGVRAATTQGMGFHAHSFGGFDNTIAGNNAQFRASGSIWVVPVELMNFDVQ